MKHTNSIDPQAIPMYAPFWAIYGPDCFPSMLCARLNDRGGAVTIWGYSVYRRQPGFRTLGQDFGKWQADHSNATFFLNADDAFAALRKMVVPSDKFLRG